VGDGALALDPCGEVVGAFEAATGLAFAAVAIKVGGEGLGEPLGVSIADDVEGGGVFSVLSGAPEDSDVSGVALVEDAPGVGLAGDVDELGKESRLGALGTAASAGVVPANGGAPTVLHVDDPVGGGPVLSFERLAEAQEMVVAGLVEEFVAAGGLVALGADALGGALILLLDGEDVVDPLLLALGEVAGEVVEEADGGGGA
jgi:hypothetical protein